MDSGFKADWDARDGVRIVRVDGRLDISRSEAMESQIRERLREEPAPLVLNLSRVTYISSSGVGALLGLYRYCTELRQRMVLAEVSQPVQKLLDVVELGQIFRIAPSETEAIKTVRGEA